MPEFGNPFAGLALPKDRTITNPADLARAIRFAIAAEHEAVQLYTQLADSIKDKTTAKILKDIADEEIVHIGEFMAVLKKMNPDEEKLQAKGEKEVEKLTGNFDKAVEEAYKSLRRQI